MTEDPAKTNKLEQRLHLAQSEKRFYEAHQIYKTIYFRCTGRRKYAEALEHLIPGSKFLLANQQWESGVDLACLVVDTISKSSLKMTEKNLADFCELVSLMPPTCGDREKYISKVLKLLSGSKLLLNDFNEFLGRQFWQEGALIQTRNRMIRTDNGFVVGCFLIELQQRYGLTSEIDLFITQTVLQFLCMKKICVAAATFYTYTRRHPKLEPGPPFTHFPLLNFVWLLMLAIEQKLGSSVLSCLCNKYSPQISRDPSYFMYLEKIGQVYFDVQPQQNPLTSILSNLTKMLGDTFDDDANNDRTDGPPSTSCSMHVDEID
ncbi:unnamed protein product [Schistocephalus solidus]|uniref:Golgi to ER traffic protein 4 homolog B n=1 Tax=Schistocephalus solidus TaxID=70667 RepID=A0A183SIA8_SCHSO|nr:unnamed protein product [Schistocephalus solidus]